jgi:hypothetical protein
MYHVDHPRVAIAGATSALLPSCRSSAAAFANLLLSWRQRNANQLHIAQTDPGITQVWRCTSQTLSLLSSIQSHGCTHILLHCQQQGHAHKLQSCAQGHQTPLNAGRAQASVASGAGGTATCMARCTRRQHDKLAHTLDGCRHLEDEPATLKTPLLTVQAQSGDNWLMHCHQ